MTDVLLPVYHLGQLRGFLSAKDASPEVMASADALYAAALRGTMASEAQDVLHHILPRFDQILKMVGAQNGQRRSPAPDRDAGEAIPACMDSKAQPRHNLGSAEASCMDAKAVPEGACMDAKAQKPEPSLQAEQPEPILERVLTAELPPEKTKRKPEWSEEARAAAAERIRKRNVERKMVRKAASADPVPDEPAKPFVPVPVDKLQTVHSGYAGNRDPNQLLADSDAPDIQAMLREGIGIRKIADDYGVRAAEMNSFVDKHLLREGSGKDGVFR